MMYKEIYKRRKKEVGIERENAKGKVTWRKVFVESKRDALSVVFTVHATE